MYVLYALYNDNWVNILPMSNNLAWTSDKDTLSVQLTFDSMYDMDEGVHVILKNDDNYIFRGIVTKKLKKKFTSSYNVYDYAFYLNKNTTVIQFNNTDSNIAIEELCNQFGIDCQIIEIDYDVRKKTKRIASSGTKRAGKTTSNDTQDVLSILGMGTSMGSTVTPIFRTTTKKTKVGSSLIKVYKDKTLASILEDILNQATLATGIRYTKEYINTTLVVSVLNSLKIYPRFLLNKDIAVTTNIEDMKNKVIVVSNIESKNTILAEKHDSANMSKYGTIQGVVTVEQRNESQAGNIANTYLTNNNKVFKEITFGIIDIEDCDDVKANRMLEMEEPSMGLSGWYRVKTANHTLNNNIHKVTVTLNNDIGVITV